jgi:uncharacterized protein YeaO (DUF488 family)
MRQQRQVLVGRVYDPRGVEDGTRVLVDRLWPRGLTKDQADVDEWCKQVAPSADLRNWYRHDPDRFAEFSRRYRAELDDPDRADALRHLRELAKRRPLILLTATRTADLSAAAVLADLLNIEKKSG